MEGVLIVSLTGVPLADCLGVSKDVLESGLKSSYWPGLDEGGVEGVDDAV